MTLLGAEQTTSLLVVLIACRGPGNTGIPQGAQERTHASAAAPDRQGTRYKAAKGQGKARAPGKTKPPHTAGSGAPRGRGR